MILQRDYNFERGYDLSGGLQPYQKIERSFLPKFTHAGLCSLFKEVLFMGYVYLKMGALLMLSLQGSYDSYRGLTKNLL